MAQSFSRNQPDNTYTLDAESGAEMARLIDQDRIVTQAMGGLFSERENLSTIFDVLDIGCGPGSWVLDVAHSYPEMEVTGIDISKHMIQYAQAHAQVRKLPNVHFQVMDALHPLHFPDASFDLINARTIFAFMTLEAWPRLVKECQRILRPGGVLRLTETESGFSNKVGLETFLTLINEASFKAGRSFSPTGRHTGITPMLERFLHTAGFQNIGSKAHVVNGSAGASAHRAIYEDCKKAFILVQPFLIATGVTTQEKIERLYEQTMNEMLEKDFCGITYFLTVWGENTKRED